MIYVVYNLFRPQIATEVLLHHQAMLSNVSMTISAGMSWAQDKNIALVIYIAPAFPSGIVCAFWPGCQKIPDLAVIDCPTR